MALAFSRYLLCQDRSETDACGECPSCVKLDQLAHPDVHFVFPVILSAKTRTSDDILPEFRKAVQEHPYMGVSWWYNFLGEEKKQGVISVRDSDDVVKKLSLKAFEGGYKIMIIWMPEMLNIAAANKLLKIIEEPPERTLFILVAEHHEKLLATIISRTQQVRLPALKDEDVVQELRKRQVDPNRAADIARISNGNLHKAIETASKGADDQETFMRFRDWMRLCFKKDVKGAVRWVDEIATLGREKQKTLLVYAMHIFRECMIGNYTHEDMVRLAGSELEFSKGFAQFIKGSNILQLTEAFNEACFHIERNANPRILFLDLSFKVFRLLKS